MAELLARMTRNRPAAVYLLLASLLINLLGLTSSRF